MHYIADCPKTWGGGGIYSVLRSVVWLPLEAGKAANCFGATVAFWPRLPTCGPGEDATG